MSAEPKAVSPVLIGVVGILGTLPFSVAMVLNFMRPDLMGAMLDHVFGYGVVLVVALLTLVGTGVALFVVTAKQEKPGLQVGLSLGAFFLCTVPALLLVVFGPIVFAFMFGHVDGAR